MKAITFLSIPMMLVFLSIRTNAQLISVSGTIQDNLFGKTIQQISVVEAKSGVGTISSFNGTFILLLKKGEVKLSFSDNNYETFNTSFVLTRDTTIYVKLNAVNLGTSRKEKQGNALQSGFVANQPAEKK
jgi:hypothetical protein